MLGIERGGLVSFVVVLGLCFAACGGGNAGDDDSAGGESGESGSKPSGGAAGKGSSGKGGTGGGATGGKDGTGGSLPMLAGRSGGGTGGTGGAIGGTGGTGGTGGASGGTGGGTSGGPGEAGDTSNPGSGGNGGTGGTIGDAGDGGTGGTAPGGRGGGAGAGMGGSGGAAPTGSALGMPCAEDTDCAEGLTCFQADDEIGFGPPGGTCTAACEEDVECDDLASGAICISGGAKGLFCVLGCTVGEAVTKCHERPDAVCGIGYLLLTSGGCESYTDCLSGEVCSFDGYCSEPVTGCLPWCRGDFDCESGQFCDGSSGYCVAAAPVGSDYGELCDPSASTDECAGTCFASGTAYDGVCSSFCSFLPDSTGCGWDGTGSADNACLFGTILTDQAQLGDLGVCAKLCDCNHECPAEGDYCGAEFTDFISDTWGHAGYCRPLLEDEVVGDTLVCDG